uniref:Uncharacterized protein n=1 Tax=Zea mays TaxID=4577 RepID=C4J8G5_MAIZE|nr:unknown [Zea mays]
MKVTTHLVLYQTRLVAFLCLNLNRGLQKTLVKPQQLRLPTIMCLKQATERTFQELVRLTRILLLRSRSQIMTGC